jgi:hypothetical protein
VLDLTALTPLSPPAGVGGVFVSLLFFSAWGMFGGVSKRVCENRLSEPLRNKDFRSYWIPGSYAPTVSENRGAFLRPLENKEFKEERVTEVGADDLDTSTTLESNKSLAFFCPPGLSYAAVGSPITAARTFWLRKTRDQ